MPADPKPMHEADTPWFRVTILDANTRLALDLSALTIDKFKATVGQRGRTPTAGTVSFFDAPRGIVNVEFPRRTAKHPSSLFQLEVNMADRWETVWSEEIPVRQSLA